MGSLQLPDASSLSSLSSLSSVVEVAVSSAMMGSVVEVVVPVLGCPTPPPPVPPPPSPPPPLMCGPGTGVNAVSGACEIVCSAGTSRRTLEDPSAGQPLSARSIIEAFLMQQPHTMTRMEMQKALSEDQDFRLLCASCRFHPRSISSPSQARGKRRAHTLPGGGRFPAVQNPPAAACASA